MARSKTSKTRKAAGPILVTGAAGGVGRHIVMTLLDAGYKVTAIDRRPIEQAFFPAPYESHHRLSWRVCDLEDAQDLREVLRGARAVVHGAALVGLSEGYPELRRANVDLVARLARAAREESVEHFVHLSCASIYGGDTRVRGESCEIDPQNAYERSKVEGEEALWSVSGEMAWTILRLALVYGPGCTTMGAGIVTLPPILRDFVRYLPGLSGGPRTNWCHAEDVAGAVRTVLINEKAYGQVFNVADRTALSFGEVLTSLAEAYGMELGPSVPFPNGVIWAVLSPFIDHDAAFDFFRKALRYRWRRIQHAHGLASPLQPRIDRRALFYVRDEAIVISNALEELGWTRKWPDFRAGIVDTVRGYQAMGWTPRLDWSTRASIEENKPRRGIHYVEHFEGALDLQNGPSLSFNLDLECDWHNFPRLLGTTEGLINGLIWKGSESPRAIQGTVALSFRPGPRLRYQFGFEDADGAPFRFEGERRLNGRPISQDRASKDWQDLVGEVYDGQARRLGQGRLRFQRLEGLSSTLRLLSHPSSSQ